MSTPSFQCLPRWLPPPPYLCCAQDMGEPPHVAGVPGLGSQVFTVLLPKGALVKFSILANSNEDGKRVSPGGEGRSIIERRLGVS